MNRDTALSPAILKALDAAGVRLFQSTWRAKAKWEAQEHLRGRTHYADDSTLRFHHARILDVDLWADGALLVLRESVGLDWNNTRRGQRYVAIDVFGRVVSRADLDHCTASQSAARRLLDNWAATFDLDAHYRHKLAERHDSACQEARRIAEALGSPHP